MTKQKISPFLWFDQQAEDAAKFYVFIFPDSALETVVRYPRSTNPGVVPPPHVPTARDTAGSARLAG